MESPSGPRDDAADVTTPGSLVGVYSAGEVDEAVELLRRWDGIDRRYVQVQRGRFHNHFTVLELGEVSLLHSTADPGYALTGGSPAGWQALFLLRGGSTATRWCGRELVPGDLGLSLADEHTARSFGPVDLLNVSVRSDALRAHGRAIGRDDLEDGLTGSPWPDPGRARQAGLESRLARILENVSHVCGPLREPIRLELVSTLLDAVVDAVAGPLPAAKAATPASRRIAIARARDFLASCVRRVPTVPELCAAIGVSQRTIEYAFRDQLGLRPVQFLKLMRLNRARSSLVGASPASTSVTDVAMDFGFWDLGHFARDYQALFGESPSQTLRRASL
jgi:AraC family ethanolamine operon transcriptional activator